jgi:protein-arginine kinase activator protein McsA
METTKTKTDVKKHIRALKAKRDEALSRQATQEVAQIRRGIRTLKRQSRVLARAAKAQAAAAAAAPQASS